MADSIQTIIIALLSAGGATFLGTAVKSWRTLRVGARARERESIDDLARWRDELDERARRAERDRDYWRQVAGGYAWQLRKEGHEPGPADPVPPSER